MSPAELQSWMRHVQQESVDKETESQWSEMKRQDSAVLKWEEYMQHTYRGSHGDCYMLNCFNGFAKVFFFQCNSMFSVGVYMKHSTKGI